MRGDPGSTAYVQAHWEELKGVSNWRLFEGLWSGARAGWLMIGAAICFAAQRIGWKWGGLFAAIVIFTAIGALFIAADMSRTLVIETPVLLLGAWLWSEAKTPSTRYLLPAVLAANLILPAQHVLWPFAIPIRYLYSSIDGYRDPPAALLPETYFELGKQLREQGNRPGAEWGYEMALRLDKNFADAYAARASMRLEQGNMVDAQTDLDTALRLKPDLSDGLLLRAAFRRGTGEAFGAIGDLQHALDTAPPDWPLRGETQKFLDEIKSKTIPAVKPSP